MLGAVAIRESVNKAGIRDTSQIDEVYMGNVVGAGIGQAPARQAAIFAGLPFTVGATTINKVCGSGLKAVMVAAQAIKASDGDLFVCGGMESMSQVPYLADIRRGNLKFGHSELSDALVVDGLWDPFEKWIMGEAAEYIADFHQISRKEMDEYAFRSHQKAARARGEGEFSDEIVRVEIEGRKGKITIFEQDETIREDSSIELLSRLSPVFKENGKVTAGNAPGLNDGASALVISSRQKAEEIGSNILASVVGYTQSAVEPKHLFDAPSVAIPKLLNIVGWQMDQVDLVELNEAFAAQILANGKVLAGIGWDWGKVNVNGGAIALGHPIGASGARVLTTLLFALKNRGLKRGIVSLCLGGAEAVAMAVELEE
jgi:acetyl-CoA C-acetyltransferase